jgi:hypothetical protein
VAGAPRPSKAASREPLTPEEVRKALADALSASGSKQHARILGALEVDDVAALTRAINRLIARPLDKARIEKLKVEDAKIRDRQKKNDAVAKRVQGILGRLDGKRDRKLVAGYRGILGDLAKLRSLIGEPLFTPQRGRPPEARSFMMVEIAIHTLRVLQRVAARCGVRLQDSVGKTNESPVPLFTKAMLKLISPGERPPEPQAIFRALGRAMARVRAAPE